MTATLLSKLPLVAILRGVRPSEAVDIAQALFAGGFLCVEVPLNSPEPLKSVEAIRNAFDGRMLIGAGTVLTAQQVHDVRAAGGEFVVSPNTDARVIAETKAQGLLSLPGFFSPSEAFAAIAAGADALKLFPADQLGPDYVKALRQVVPREAPMLAVGGVDESKMEAFCVAGADGFGFGSTLYRPGSTPEDVRRRATALIEAFAKRCLR